MNEIDEIENQPLLLQLRVKFATSALEELALKLELTDSVSFLKMQIQNQRNLSATSILRLIYNGKLLAPDDATLETFNLKNDSYVHAVVTNKPPRIVESSAVASVSDATREPSTDSIRTGFDALRTTHRLSRDDVAVFRSYFSQQLAVYAADGVPRLESESNEDYMRRIETAWMAVQGPGSEFHFNLNMTGARWSANSLINENGWNGLTPPTDRSIEIGTWQQFIYGVFLGYLLGFIMVFCIWDGNIPYRQKLGLLVGIMIQLSLTFAWRVMMQANQHLANVSDSGDSSSTHAIDAGGNATTIHHYLRY